MASARKTWTPVQATPKDFGGAVMYMCVRVFVCVCVCVRRCVCLVIICSSVDVDVVGVRVWVCRVGSGHVE